LRNEANWVEAALVITAFYESNPILRSDGYPQGPGLAAEVFADRTQFGLDFEEFYCQRTFAVDDVIAEARAHSAGGTRIQLHV